MTSRSKVVGIRVSKEEYAQLEKAAEGASVPGWLREVGLREVNRPRFFSALSTAGDSDDFVVRFSDIVAVVKIRGGARLLLSSGAQLDLFGTYETVVDLWRQNSR